MALSKRYVSGSAVAIAAMGVVLIVAGLRNASIADTLRALIRGQPPPAGPSMLEPRAVIARAAGTAGGSGAGTAGGPITGRVPSGGSMAKAAVEAARKYLGIRYVFGGHDPSTGFDCSGLVTWVLHRDLGIDLPNNTHTVTGQWYVWPGAVDVPWSEMSAGDLVCWPGHIGIATGGGRMIHAPSAGDVVREAEIWRVPEPVIRRPKAYFNG